MKGILIPTNLARLAAVAAAAATPRFDTCGVRVTDRNGAYRVEATDGRKLAIVRGECDVNPDGPSPVREFTVPAADWQDALRALAKIKPPRRNESAPAILSAGAGRFRFEGPGYAKDGALLEGRWPDVDDALPKGPPRAVARFNPAFLKTLCELAVALEMEAVDLLFYGPDKPVGLAGRNGRGQFLDGLVMPLSRPEPPARRAPAPAPGEPPGVETGPEVGQNGDGHGNGRPH